MKNYLFLLSILLLVSSCKDKYTYGESITPSGYEYTVHTKGSGEKAKKGDFVKFSFEVIGSDSVSIQKSDSPENYPVVQIPMDDTEQAANPVMDVFLGAMVGDSMTVWMPIDSMPQPNPAFANLTYLKYVMTIKSITDETAFKAEEEAKKVEAAALAQVLQAKETEIAELVKITLFDYKKGKIKPEVTETGLKYFVHKQGTGEAARIGENVSVNYYGILASDGSMFDNSYKRGQPITFAVGKGAVIPGWDEALLMLPKGSEATLFIPSDLAYGAADRPGIPGGSELVFHVVVE